MMNQLQHYTKRYTGLHGMALLALVMVAGLSGCESTGTLHMAENNKLAGPPIGLAVTRIEILPDYTPPATPQHVEDRMPVAPMEAVTIWAQQNLKAVGQGSLLRIDVTDASVVESQLEVERSAWEVFSPDVIEQYNATLEVTFKLYTPPSLLPVAEVSMQVTRSLTVSPSASLDERNVLFNQLITLLMSDFDHEARAKMDEYFSDYIIIAHY